MTNSPSLLGYERLEADLASVQRLFDKRAQSDWVAPVRTTQSAWGGLQLSRKASATAAASLGFALLASTALLMRSRSPAKPSIVEVVPMTSRLAPRRVAELQPTADTPAPIIRGGHEGQSLEVRQGHHDLMKQPLAPDINTMLRHPARTEVTVASLAAGASGMPTFNNDLAVEPVQSPAIRASIEKSASPPEAMLNTEPGAAGDPSISEQVGSSLQLKRARRASIDAIRFLRRQ